MSGRRAKRLRREGKRPTKTLPPSTFESKTDLTFDKTLYRERRKKGLPGMPQAAVVVQSVFDKKGTLIDILPISGKKPSSTGGKMRKLGKVRDGKFTKKGHASFVQQHMAAKASGRGD